MRKPHAVDTSVIYVAPVFEGEPVLPPKRMPIRRVQVLPDGFAYDGDDVSWSVEEPPQIDGVAYYDKHMSLLVSVAAPNQICGAPDDGNRHGVTLALPSPSLVFLAASGGRPPRPGLVDLVPITMVLP